METEPLKVFCRNCQSKMDVSDLEPYSMFECPECGTLIRVPERFGRYLLEKVCGKGGMASIYRAIDVSLARRVAVKIADQGTAGQRDFFEISKIVTRINHPAIVPVYDCGICNDRPFMVMKFMDAGDMEKMMFNHALPPVPKLAGYMAFVAAGLAAMAEKGFAHHDIKPANIMLASPDEAKLGDLDLADIREYGDVYTPCPCWGSPGYLSPERLYYGGEDQRGDIFSLGATIYELFSGLLPFGVEEDRKELYRRRESMEFAALASVIPGMPKDFSDLLSGMLAFKMEDRPNYSEIINGLAKLAGEFIIRENNPTWAERISGWFKRKRGE